MISLEKTKISNNHIVENLEPDLEVGSPQDKLDCDQADEEVTSEGIKLKLKEVCNREGLKRFDAIKSHICDLKNINWSYAIEVTTGESVSHDELEFAVGPVFEIVKELNYSFGEYKPFILCLLSEDDDGCFTFFILIGNPMDSDAADFKFKYSKLHWQFHAQIEGNVYVDHSGLESVDMLELDKYIDEFSKTENLYLYDSIQSIPYSSFSDYLTSQESR